MNDVLEELRDLAMEFSLAKLTEDLAKKKRIAIEEQIALLIPGKETGQETVTLANGSKLVVKRGLNYRADLVEISRICERSSMTSPVKTKTTQELDVQGYEWYKEKHPSFFEYIVQHVTVTPKKVSVVLKPAKEK